MGAEPGTILYDLAIVGGGINGCGIARDAAGRGLSVYLCEQNDLASGTSSWSTKLIHGGLRYLEHYEFRLVREALVEREVLWALAPHIIRPLRFVLPHHRGLRPAPLLRLGLFLYDHLGGRRLLPPTRTLDLARDPAGGPLKPAFRTGFEYSDCWVDDARLVVLNAMDARAKGARIETRARFVSGQRQAGHWLLQVERGGRTVPIAARALVNAAGPWVADVLASRLRLEAGARVRLVQGSHIVVPRLFEHDRSYIFQNADGRIVFAIPYEGAFTLIGTTDHDFEGDPAQVAATDDDINYLCAAVSEYFARPVSPRDVVWAYAGVRPLYDDGASRAQEATRDYVLKLDAPEGAAPLLSVFGGKITTYRRLAEAALQHLAPSLPRPASGRAAGWTGREPLPGGDFPVEGFEALLQDLRARFPFLAAQTAVRLARSYGTRAFAMLDGCRALPDLGADFGAGLSEREVAYLLAEEWAVTAEDILWRRSKLGLHIDGNAFACLQLHLAEQPAAA